MKNLLTDINKLSKKYRANILGHFFKTGPGEYGEGDKFLGLTVPECRSLAKKCQDISLAKVTKLLHNPWHETRLIALLILVFKYQKTDEKLQEKIFKLYLANTKYINNWDLVDLSAYKIVGTHLLNKDRKVLYKLAESKSLWERRISIVATYYFIKNNDYKDTYLLSKKLIGDKEDLIHKATGWMLREAGKRDLKKEMKFLDKYSSIMSRTMLRYSIEKFPEEWRLKYLRKPSKMLR